MLGQPPRTTWEGLAVHSEDVGFQDLYDAEFGRVAGYCFQLTRNWELSQDLAQEAFVRLFSRWRTVREPRPYLFHIATNLVRRAWRDQLRERVAWGEPDQAAGAALPDLSVRDAVDRLPAKYRDVVLLHYYADLTVSAVAQAVRRPDGSVKRLLSEARALLAMSLEDSHA